MLSFVGDPCPQTVGALLATGGHPGTLHRSVRASGLAGTSVGDASSAAVSRLTSEPQLLPCLQGVKSFVCCIPRWGQGRLKALLILTITHLCTASVCDTSLPMLGHSLCNVNSTSGQNCTRLPRWTERGRPVSKQLPSRAGQPQQVPGG